MNLKAVVKCSVLGMSFLLAHCGSDLASDPNGGLLGGLSSIGAISSSGIFAELSSSSVDPVLISSSDAIPVEISSSSMAPELMSSSNVIPVEISSSSVVIVQVSSSNVVIVPISSSSVAAPISSSTVVTPPAIKVLLAGTNVNANGPLETVLQENISFSGGGNLMVRPKNMTTEPNTKHPVVIWGPGGGTPPKDYLMLITRLASQGFVVVGIRESSGQADLMSAAIDWLEQQNKDSNSPMYGKLILDRVGVAGHSMGGLSSEQAALKDPRVATALLNNSGAFDHAQLVNMKVPTGIIYGEDGMERPNAEGDYNNAANRGPLWLGMMANGGHGSGPWDGAGANVSWMRWHIGGESARKNDFMGQGGAYNNTGIWTTKFKNWENWKLWSE